MFPKKSLYEVGESVFHSFKFKTSAAVKSELCLKSRLEGTGLRVEEKTLFRITGPVKTLILALSGHSVKFIALILPRNQHYLVAVLPKASCSALLPPNSSNFLINTPSHLWSWSPSIPGWTLPRCTDIFNTPEYVTWEDRVFVESCRKSGANHLHHLIHHVRFPLLIMKMMMLRMFFYDIYSSVHLICILFWC